MELVILGTGEHSKVVAQVATESPETNIIGFIDSRPNWVDKNLWLGDDSVLDKGNFSKNCHFFVAVGDNLIRKKLINKLKDKGFTLTKLISKESKIAPNVKIGLGSLVMPGAIINSCAEVGEGVIVNTNSSIDHDCKLEDFVHVAPGATIAGGVVVGSETFIGAGATLRDHIFIGSRVVIGMASGVVSDLESNFIYFGVPARKVRKNASK